MEIVEKPWCVWEVFQRLEEADPSFVALVDGGVGVTRTELRQRTEELDRLLRSLGVVRGSPVMLVNECNTFALVRPLTHAPHRLPHSRRIRSPLSATKGPQTIRPRSSAH